VPLRVLVTRPQPQADAWVARLRCAGLDAAALPLIAIAPAPDIGLLREAWQGLQDDTMAVFVSPSAVTHFFAAAAPVRPWPDGVLAAAPGPGTAQALRMRGVPPELVLEPPPQSAQFDSEALWHGTLSQRGWQGRAVLIVHGGAGRDWLADTLAAHGARTHGVIAYVRGAPRLDAHAQELLDDALAFPTRHLWLLSSSLAVQHLARIAGPHTHWAGARALATHARIAEAARALGMWQVVEARPSEADVVACIRGIGEL
jgi:uroporphyrinogen-III synthase